MHIEVLDSCSWLKEVEPEPDPLLVNPHLFIYFNELLYSFSTLTNLAVFL